MNSPLNQYTTSIRVGPADKPDLGFTLQWSSKTRQLTFSCVVDVSDLLSELAAEGCIEVKNIPPERQVATASFNYPILDESALRAFAFANSSGLASMLMGIASDLTEHAR